MKTFSKQPDEVLAYDLDFTTWFAQIPDDYIVSATCIVVSSSAGDPTNLVVGSVLLMGDVVDQPPPSGGHSLIVKVWTSGGLNGATYTLTLSIVTNDGRAKDADFKIKVKDVAAVAESVTLSGVTASLLTVANTWVLPQNFASISLPGTTAQYVRGDGSLATLAAVSQPVDPDLTAIAAIASTGAGALAMDATGGWIKKSWAAVAAALGLGNYGLLSGTIEQFADEIAAGATITVAPSGAMYTTVTDAMAYIDSLKIVPFGLTIQVGDGTYTHTAPLSILDYKFQGVKIVDQNAYVRTMSSVQSSSGSTGAWSVVLNLNSVANIALNDYVTITNPSGGTLPTYVAGAHKVTNVDAVNTRITIASKHKAATAPSGAVAATVTVLKAILSFSGCDGIRVWSDTTLGNFSNIMVVGDGTASWNGLSIQDNGRFYFSGTVGIVDFGTNVLALCGGEINGTTIVASNATNYNFLADTGGIIIGASYSVASGSQQVGGVAVTRGGIIYLLSAVITGNTYYGIYAAQRGLVTVTGTAISGNWMGVKTLTSGYVDPAGITLSTNTTPDSRDLLTLIAVGANVASATSITPAGQVFHVTGVTTVQTIVLPYSGFVGPLVIIPDGVFVTGITDNIALASTTVVGKALTYYYDVGTTKWYPSY